MREDGGWSGVTAGDDESTVESSEAENSLTQAFLDSSSVYAKISHIFVVQQSSQPDWKTTTIPLSISSPDDEDGMKEAEEAADRWNTWSKLVLDKLKNDEKVQ